jgi:hypothetical protein
MEYRMELKTRALDRVLEALSPALAKELERLVQETRDELEQQFQQRLQAVVREAQAAAHRETEGELQRRVAETREATRKQVIEEVEERFKTTLEENNNKIQKEAAERRALEEELSKWRVLVQAPRQFADAATQAEILTRFLKLAEPFAAGLAVYVAKADGFAVWKTHGNGGFSEIISEGSTNPESYFRTIVVRGKAVAAVCALPPCKMEIIDYFVSSVERAIEIFGLRLNTPSPKLTPPKPDGGDDEKTHADARRTARRLVSEIKLYNEGELKAGRENNDIYRRLQNEIEHGREAYTQRVSDKILGSRDYFHEELIRILGENDESRMGANYPGPNVQ